MPFNKKWGFINGEGKEICSPKYDSVGNFSEGFADVCNVFKNKCKYGFINTNGKKICSIKYDEVKPFKDGFAKVKRDGKWFFINEEGKEVSDPNMTE